MKITIMRAHPGPQSWFFCFPIGPRANGGRVCTRFLRLLSFLIFSRGYSHQRRRYCHLQEPATMFRYRFIAVQRFAAPKVYTLQSCQLALVRSTGGRLQMDKWTKFQSILTKNETVMSIWSFSITPLPLTPPLTRPQTCVGHFSPRARN